MKNLVKGLASIYTSTIVIYHTLLMAVFLNSKYQELIVGCQTDSPAVNPVKKGLVRKGSR